MTVPNESILNGSALPEYDVVIIGGGFGGLYLLKGLRDAGFKVRVLEAGGGLGGVWYWNCYPGARVDSSVPIYEYSDEKVWKDWQWSERFPGYKELQDYFKHVDNVYNLSQDIQFNTFVTGASYDDSSNKWTITAQDGTQVRSQFFIPCTGFAAKKYIPDIKGLQTFQGKKYHTAEWPQTGIDLSGKRIAIIGTGATGVQLIQEAGKVASELTVFQRTPNLTLPMRQGKLDKTTHPVRSKKYYDHRLTTFDGGQFDILDKSVFDASPEDREHYFQTLYDRGGFEFWHANYRDIRSNREANDIAYEFWRRATQARIKDPTLAEILAPKIAPHPFGFKRISLEQDYYEILGQPNVHLVDLKKTDIVEVEGRSIKTSDGREYEVDLLLLATGFDSITGGLLQIDIRGSNGLSLREKWKNGTWTYLGLSVSGFPNMFFLYGPQSPCAFSSGPTLSEIQGNWVIETIKNMRKLKQTRIDPKKEAESDWKNLVESKANGTLITEVKSWYMGDNIPGKPRECLNYVGGIPDYRDRLSAATKAGYNTFKLT